MSWDVLVFNFQGKPPPPPESMDSGPKPPALGKADEVRRAISARLPGTDWSEPAWGVLEGEGYSIEFNIGGEDPVPAMMLHVRGGGDPVSAIAELCTSTGWSALDCSTNQWLDPANPSQRGWGEFQKFRDRAIAALPPPDCPGCGRKLSPASRPCLYCGWSPASGLKPSAEPHPAAPGRPPEEGLADAFDRYRRWRLLTIPIAIAVAVTIAFVWPVWRSPKEVDRDARMVLLATYAYVASAQEAKPLPDGRVEAGPKWPHPEYVVTAADGKKCVGDPWMNPVRVFRTGPNLTVYSFGPNGRDESGQGDDVKVELPRF